MNSKGQCLEPRLSGRNTPRAPAWAATSRKPDPCGKRPWGLHLVKVKRNPYFQVFSAFQLPTVDFALEIQLLGCRDNLPGMSCVNLANQQINSMWACSQSCQPGGCAESWRGAFPGINVPMLIESGALAISKNQTNSCLERNPGLEISLGTDSDVLGSQREGGHIFTRLPWGQEASPQ